MPSASNRIMLRNLTSKNTSADLMPGKSGARVQAYQLSRTTISPDDDTLEVAVWTMGRRELPQAAERRFAAVKHEAAVETGDVEIWRNHRPIPF